MLPVQLEAPLRLRRVFRCRYQSLSNSSLRGEAIAGGCPFRGGGCAGPASDLELNIPNMMYKSQSRQNNYYSERVTHGSWEGYAD